MSDITRGCCASTMGAPHTAECPWTERQGLASKLDGLIQTVEAAFPAECGAGVAASLEACAGKETRDEPLSPSAPPLSSVERETASVAESTGAGPDGPGASESLRKSEGGA